MVNSKKIIKSNCFLKIEVKERELCKYGSTQHLSKVYFELFLN